MMDRILLDIPKSVHAEIRTHLLPKRFVFEEAAFMYVKQDRRKYSRIFRYVDWEPVSEDGFLSRTCFHFELTEETKAAVIKRAHDLGASIVEFHSHKGRWPAEFSASDLEGFQEFVPHVWWRLKSRPYLAVVVSRSGFDGFVWITDANTPHRLDAIIVNKSVFRPTKLSPMRLDFDERNDRKTLRS